MSRYLTPSESQLCLRLAAKLQLYHSFTKPKMKFHLEEYERTIRHKFKEIGQEKLIQYLKKKYPSVIWSDELVVSYLYRNGDEIDFEADDVT